jgi:hypothetical protein
LALAPNADSLQKTESVTSVIRKSLFSSRIFQPPAVARYIADEIEPSARRPPDRRFRICPSHCRR